MYCKNCGKDLAEQLPVDEMCESCYAEKMHREQEANTEVVISSEPEKISKPRMRGLEKALMANLIGMIGFVLAAFSSIFTAFDYLSGVVLINFSDSAVLFAFLSVPIIASIILSFVFGVQSVIAFFKAKGKKPIATVVLGVIAILNSLIDMLAGFAAFALIITELIMILIK